MQATMAQYKEANEKLRKLNAGNTIRCVLVCISASLTCGHRVLDTCVEVVSVTIVRRMFHLALVCRDLQAKLKKTEFEKTQLEKVRLFVLKCSSVNLWRVLPSVCEHVA